ncbi:hypothetical protein F5146DRAFT_1000494 [Armillaria mellea]|nr:hypothetical protein F5146DRAFT_1000494 [Armillaria mellea]
MSLCATITSFINNLAQILALPKARRPENSLMHRFAARGLVWQASTTVAMADPPWLSTNFIRDPARLEISDRWPGERELGMVRSVIRITPTGKSVSLATRGSLDACLPSLLDEYWNLNTREAKVRISTALRVLLKEEDSCTAFGGASSSSSMSYCTPKTDPSEGNWRIFFFLHGALYTTLLIFVTHTEIYINTYTARRWSTKYYQWTTLLVKALVPQNMGANHQALESTCYDAFFPNATSQVLYLYLHDHSRGQCQFKWARRDSQGTQPITALRNHLSGN